MFDPESEDEVGDGDKAYKGSGVQKTQFLAIVEG